MDICDGGVNILCSPGTGAGSTGDCLHALKCFADHHSVHSRGADQRRHCAPQIEYCNNCPHANAHPALSNRQTCPSCSRQSANTRAKTHLGRPGIWRQAAGADTRAGAAALHKKEKSDESSPIPSHDTASAPARSRQPRLPAPSSASPTDHLPFSRTIFPRIFCHHSEASINHESIDELPRAGISKFMCRPACQDALHNTSAELSPSSFCLYSLRHHAAVLGAGPPQLGEGPRPGAS